MDASIESKWDRLLKIKTSGRDDSQSDQFHHPYEPTSYAVLERLANSGYLSKKNALVDYGSGKGRTGFFFSYQLRMNTIGVEFDERMYKAAMANRETAVSGARTAFVWQGAENYAVPENVDRFYFFNPFPVPILQAVLGRIAESYYSAPRQLYLFFYYPSDEYVAYLMTHEMLLFEDEIDCRDIFGNEDKRERILIFTIE